MTGHGGKEWLKNSSHNATSFRVEGLEKVVEVAVEIRRISANHRSLVWHGGVVSAGVS